VGESIGWNWSRDEGSCVIYFLCDKRSPVGRADHRDFFDSRGRAQFSSRRVALQFSRPAGGAEHQEPIVGRESNRSFVAAGLEKVGLHPGPAAEKAALLRRVTYDLIGLPPTPAELDAFLADNSEGAYTHVVDRLLASPGSQKTKKRSSLTSKNNWPHSIRSNRKNCRKRWPFAMSAERRRRPTSSKAAVGTDQPQK
jgi:hypothetical protein